jgi:3-oxoacyl-[acyl-carrier protein] reductase
MDLQLDGKRAFVSGSSSGLGEAIALELAAEGVSVVVHGRDRTRAGAVAAEIAKRGGQAAVAIGDLTRDDEAAATAETARSAFGGIDILVNSAGGAVRSDNPDWMDVTPQDWLDSFNLNVVSALRLAQAFAPAMVAQGWGRIINISSVAGQQAQAFLQDYASAKAAVDHLTLGLSKSLAPKGVTVNTVVPGTVMTPAVERWLKVLREQNGWPDDLAENERVYTSEFLTQSLPRLGRPPEIGAMVAFLCSPRADYTTGGSFRVDGGMASGR